MTPFSNVSQLDIKLTSGHRRELIEAIKCLENRNFATRLADYAGQPVNALIKYMPKAVNRRLRESIQVAILKCLELAIDSIGHDDMLKPPEWAAKMITGFTGGVGGFFGIAALPIELPLTTTLMLRSIAEIARSEGEDIKKLETMLACLEVFAMGDRDSNNKVDIDYYAVRMMLGKFATDITSVVMERGAINASSPVFAKMVGEIVSRFGLVVSDMAAASAVPFIGAIGGATINMIFMDHFQCIARGHFIVRRLERIYGAEFIHVEYLALAHSLSVNPRKKYKNRS